MQRICFHSTSMTVAEFHFKTVAQIYNVVNLGYGLHVNRTRCHSRRKRESRRVLKFWIPGRGLG